MRSENEDLRQKERRAGEEQGYDYHEQLIVNGLILLNCLSLTPSTQYAGLLRGQKKGEGGTGNLERAMGQRIGHPEMPECWKND